MCIFNVFYSLIIFKDWVLFHLAKLNISWSQKIFNFSQYLVAMFAKTKLLDKIVTCYFVIIIKMVTTIALERGGKNGWRWDIDNCILLFYKEMARKRKQLVTATFQIQNTHLDLEFDSQIVSFLLFYIKILIKLLFSLQL